MLEASTLRRLLEYDPETGVFTWRVSPAPIAPVGRQAGYEHCRGYIQIQVRGRAYMAHRLAWLYVHGEWPPCEIDHVNCIRDDNRIANLRLATRAKNMANTKRRCTNKSGAKGVCWHKGHRRWMAQIMAGGKNTHLGYFDRVDEAADAYRSAAKKKFGAFARVELHEPIQRP